MICPRCYHDSMRVISDQINTSMLAFAVIKRRAWLICRECDLGMESGIFKKNLLTP